MRNFILCLGVVVSCCISHSSYSEEVEYDVEKWCKPDSDVRVVPNILGLREGEAKSLLSKCDIELNLSKEFGAVSYVKRGLIGMQNPSAGSVIKKGSVTISAFTSMGIPIPDLRHLDKDVVQNWLKSVQLAAVVQTRRSPVNEGRVLVHSPKNREFLDASTPVDLIVSAGLKVSVPNTVGEGYKNAVSMLKSSNLIGKLVSGSLDEGRRRITNCEWEYWWPVVSSTDPEAGKVVEEKSTVSISVRTHREFVFTDAPAGDAGCM